MQYGDPSQLARREFYRIAYGAHPYAHVDATAAGIERIRRADLQAWHRAHVVPNNSFLVVAGSVTGEQVTAAAERAFRTWRRRDVPALAYPELAPRTAREVVVVSRPGSVQSVICVGNLAIARSHPDWVSLTVANQVLGGSPAARLFMDLRERRSLTYGAYSSVDDLAEPGPFRARAAVPNDRTVPAMDAFMEHLTRIVGEEVPTEELGHAEQFLSDSFPLYIDTPARLAWMVAELRTFGLPDDYWDGYRSQIRAVTSAEALRAAQAHIHPDTAIVVVVGDASVVAEPLRRYRWKFARDQITCSLTWLGLGPRWRYPVEHFDRLEVRLVPYDVPRFPQRLPLGSLWAPKGCPTYAVVFLDAQRRERLQIEGLTLGEACHWADTLLRERHEWFG